MDERTFAVVELFGHKTVAGEITKSTGAFPMLRIDVPATSVCDAFTVEYGPQAVYSIRYVSEEVAKRAAEQLKEKPVSIYSPDFEYLDQLRSEIRQLRGKSDPAEEESPF